MTRSDGTATARSHHRRPPVHLTDTDHRPLVGVEHLEAVRALSALLADVDAGPGPAGGHPRAVLTELSDRCAMLSTPPVPHPVA